MRVFKGRPGRDKGLVPYKKYKNRHSAFMDAKKLETRGKRPYIRKIGKIGSKRPYEVWVKLRFVLD